MGPSKRLQDQVILSTNGHESPVGVLGIRADVIDALSSVCDLQDKFRNAIWQFDKLYDIPHIRRRLTPSPFMALNLLTAPLLTSRKVLRAAQILKIPVIVTTQNKARLGAIVPELQELTEGAVLNVDKTRFSMMVPEIASHELLSSATKRSVVIVGIESHICVTQTALDLLAQGHQVYVLADGVSSCNEQEVPVALARLRAEGITVTTSESWLYETMGDAGIAEFRDIAKLVKESGGDTKAALAGLLSSRI
ncbi:hypothetical protein E0Z10_g6462 [Xylaria hypoxylon]|uniref:Isochorismatase-like domain-containing protein n=1 Tax=Xylaria hypoxylon TaxID=37992 RepID=A0A4Z0YE68_9PEZI|nr:hypothetical protein E0Z10_g6462 [Xylaria hypoxylon]